MIERNTVEKFAPDKEGEATYARNATNSGSALIAIKSPIEESTID